MLIKKRTYIRHDHRTGEEKEITIEYVPRRVFTSGDIDQGLWLAEEIMLETYGYEATYQFKSEVDAMAGEEAHD